MVDNFAADLVGGRHAAELLWSYLRGVVAMVLGCKSGDMGRGLSRPVSGGTSKTLEGDQASGSCSGLSCLWVMTSILTKLLLSTLFEHGTQHLGVIAVSLHLHLCLDACAIVSRLRRLYVMALWALRVVVEVVVAEFHIHFFVIVELKVVQRAVSAPD